MTQGIAAKVISEYERKLHVPDIKPPIQYILCPVGLIGSGKTTVVTALCKELSLVRISSDDVGEIIHTQEFPNDLVVLTEIMEELFSKYLDLGYSVAADTDCGTSSNQEFLQEKKEKYGLQLVWIHINPPETFILNVGLKNKPEWLFKDKNEVIEIYTRRKKVHEKLSIPFVYTFDTSLPNVGEQINEASQLIKGQGFAI